MEERGRTRREKGLKESERRGDRNRAASKTKKNTKRRGDVRKYEYDARHLEPKEPATGWPRSFPEPSFLGNGMKCSMHQETLEGKSRFDIREGGDTRENDPASTVPVVSACPRVPRLRFGYGECRGRLTDCGQIRGLAGTIFRAVLTVAQRQQGLSTGTYRGVLCSWTLSGVIRSCISKRRQRRK